MKKLFCIGAFYFIFIIAHSQTVSSTECSDNFFYGTWKDTTTNLSGGMFEESSFGFIFEPDSCCSIIYNGKLKECRSTTFMISYKIDCIAKPKQMDIEVFDLTTNTLKSALRFIFEIIDNENIRIATMSYPQYGKRPQSFNPDEAIDIKVLTRHKID
jgi:hypothetical protein